MSLREQIFAQRLEPTIVERTDTGGGAAVATATPSTLNVTVPVGVPAAGLTALTVTVSVTVWPKTDGLSDETTVVLEEA